VNPKKIPENRDLIEIRKVLNLSKGFILPEFFVAGNP
tara:strand:+ start:175465 stop:175575 length:111 start_codon:yes stop_codon:yes gene_type:complete